VGHADKSVNDRYTHHIAEEAAEQVSALVRMAGTGS
jgi:hypothetical protein